MSAIAINLNWIAIAAATAAFAVLGGIYFGALVPGRYAAVLGHERNFRVKQTALTGAGPLLSALVIVIANAVLVSALDIRGAGAGIVFGLVVAIGFLLPMTLTIAINPNFPHPIRYTLLNAPYFLVGSAVTGLILALLR